MCVMDGSIAGTWRLGVYVVRSDREIGETAGGRGRHSIDKYDWDGRL